MSLRPGADMAAYLIVQKVLTNTLRHAGAARAVVTLAYGPRAVEVTVDDDGAGMPPADQPR
jgi:signal transduction histidine kinase